MLAPAFEHCPVAVVVYPLRQLREFAGIRGRTEALLQEPVEGVAVLRTLEGEVVYAPEAVLWP